MRFQDILAGIQSFRHGLVNNWLYQSCVFLLVLGLGALPLSVHAQSRLEQIALSLEQNSSIDHVEKKMVLDALVENDSSLLLFDVRTEEEYAVSHLANATRLDPGSDPADFIRRYGGLLEENEVIFYCPTGRRSTELAEKVAAALQVQGRAVAPKNMRGGIFHWHDAFNPLNSAAGATDRVHPYSWFSKRLLTRKDQASYTP